MTNTKIPGVSFSWRRALGVTKIKRRFTNATGIPTTKSGIERKIGAAVAGVVEQADRKRRDQPREQAIKGMRPPGLEGPEILKGVFANLIPVHHCRAF